MNQKEKEKLKIEEDLKDTIENELVEQNRTNRKVEIKDIKLAGEATWKDNISGKDVSDKVFIVEKEITEIDENGKERKTSKSSYYLGDKCIGGDLGNGQIVYDINFQNAEPHKMQAINELLERVSSKELEENSMNHLRNKELAEVLTAYLGKEIKPEEVQKELDKMDEKEIEDLKEDKEQQKDKDEEELSEKQTEKVKVNGIQKVDLNKLVDGKETLGKRLDLQGYDNLYVIYSDKVDKVSKGTKRHNTTYSLVGMTNDGTAKVLNDEFDMDHTVGNSANREQTKIRANSTATRDNKDLSVYTRKSNGASIGCENEMGNVNMFLYQKTKENENVGIQIETSKTQIIPMETREIMNRNKGMYQNDKVQDEIQEHTDEGCKPKDEKDFDGEISTGTHEHFDKEYIEKCVREIFNYENEEGEEQIKEVFTENEVKDKLLRKIKENGKTLSIEQIKENVQNEMNQDAEMYSREHKR